MNELSYSQEKGPIDPGEILIGIEPDSPLQGPYRVLNLIPKQDRVVMIPIPTGPRQTSSAQQANYYALGFESFPLSQINLLLLAKKIQKTTVEIPNHWRLSDSDLRKLSPPKNDPSLSHEDRLKSPLEIKRDFKFELIKPLLPTDFSSGGPRLPDLTYLDGLVRNRAREAGVSPGQVFDALHRFYAFGCILNALLPNTISKSGAPGKRRLAKNGIKLGRKNAAAKAGNTDLAGLILSEKDTQNLEDGYLMFVKPGTSIKQAFLSMSSTFYSKGYTYKCGHLTPDLLEAHLRPTIKEFRHHGPLAKDATAAARRLMGEGEWARNYRPLTGTACDGIYAIAQVGSLDASPIDVNCVSCLDPLQPIGIGRGLFVRDAWLGLYFGWQIGLDNLRTDDAKLAILRAATDKTSTLARYNLDLPAEDFPSLFFSKYLSDNGELRSCNGIESIVDGLTSRIEFIASGRADRNSPSESGHHSRHRGFDHQLTGTTHGRKAKRGEPLAITKAILSRYEYIRLLLLWIHWANTKQELPLHMIPTEMRREFAISGISLPRTRIGIYRWAKANGYISGKPVDPTYLKAHLLPTFTASVQRNGLVLHRPDTGNTVELLHGARFNSEYVAYSGIVRDAISKGKKHISVRADPDDLSHIILLDMNGLHVIPNVKDDAILIAEGSIHDLCATNNLQKVLNVESTSSRDQAEIDQQAFRQETEADAKTRKKVAQSTRIGHKASDSKIASVRIARKAEKRADIDSEIRRINDCNDGSENSTQQSAKFPKSISTQFLAPGNTNRIVELMKNRLTKFNTERKF
ncbi:hypothetical protein H8K38_10900 [Undibacterium sp. FT79W]|uniref:hypothetical protein n=1 Tax=Undibacterium sp. FT79W TaxID=2762296 RepID=UPI00164C6AFB|nr:hypothetical protein [Undibacterium sp. FT79W]MBC3878320.1 hypothetical protein [Undibacterium sp. FT79W]